MYIFEVGQLVTENGSGEYSYTNHESLCLIEKINGEEILVKIVAHERGRSYRGWVNAEFFEPCTYAEFIEKYPNAQLVGGYTAQELSEIKIGKEVKKMELRMDKEKIGSYVLTDEEKSILRKQIIDLLVDYDYNPTNYGVEKILNEWIRNNGWMINLFKKHPKYNGKFQIVFDSDYPRTCNKPIIVEFGHWLERKAKDLRKEKKLSPFSYEECVKIYRKLDNVCDYMSYIQDRNYSVSVNGRTLEETREERDKWIKRVRVYQTAQSQGKIYLYDDISYDIESWNMYINMINFARLVRNNIEHIATEDFAYEVNRLFPKAKAVAGQKVSRIVNKVYTLSGLPVDKEYNQEYAKYTDALNPLMIKRHTIISCHPVDFLTMSFGNSWASCHTIDKKNVRNKPGSYSGAYSSGTLSYMLDGSSFVYYTVDKDYNGNEYESQDKINRNMFHMGEDKLVQARVYPQATDGDTGIYKQIREIAHKVIADCLGVPNLWKNVKGTDECRNVIYTKGTHYSDYTNFGDCNVSYLKDETDVVNKKKITVGHSPICPNCGTEHHYSEAVECDECYQDRKKCCNCGDAYDEEDMHYINGEWHCEDCCFYCDYHEEWELGDSVYVEGYGTVCEDAIDSSEDFYTCHHCGETFYTGSRRGANYIYTEDGTYFCGTDCAEREDYASTSSGEWYPADEVHFCEHCNEWVHEDDWNSELECCTECEEEVREENAEESEEREAI